MARVTSTLCGLHYDWVIVGILVIVQVIGSAISQSAGVIVTPLRDPHGGFGWGIGTIGGLMAVYYVVGARGMDILSLWQPLWYWLWRGDDGVPGGEPPVFRDGTH